MSLNTPPSNRLINEKSPYLLQHAHNPVDWFPWGEEAFQKAALEDKPIFLSIGYASCHWCHVMEKESFENVQVAKLMNEFFVNIKVDREELPEIDSIYMEFAQSMMSGSAGWPLNVILTPNLSPFFAATYLPPHSKHGMMGMTDLVGKINEVWTSEEKVKVVDQAEKIVELFEANLHTMGETLPVLEDLTQTAEILYKMADPVWGGLKGSPKFPIGYQSIFLIRYYQSFKDSRSLYLAEKTLDMMHRGGIYDHIGGGFSRYSVDEEWFQPHFEKMLYDNAILIQAYLECYLSTRKVLYRQILEDVANYVLTRMIGSHKAFLSTEDADSEGHEGLFYTWEYEEVIEVLGKTEGELFCNFYGVEPDGNFEGRNILSIAMRETEFAEANEIDPGLLSETIAHGKTKLFAIRNHRTPPRKDDKVLTSLNGLMIYSLIEAAVHLDEPRYRQAAVSAAIFIRSNMWVEGTLYRRFREGEVRYKADLDEYAYMIRASLSLFEAGEGSDWLHWALQMTSVLEDQFKMEEGAFSQTDGQDPYLLINKCSYSDGAEPSGNAIHCENLLRLWQITFEESYLRQAEDVLKAVKMFADNYPAGYVYHRMNLDRYLNQKASTIIVALGEMGVTELEIKSLLSREYLPHNTLVIKKNNDALLKEIVPSLDIYQTQGSKTTLYVCYKGFCSLPLTEASDIQEAILKLS